MDIAKVKHVRIRNTDKVGLPAGAVPAWVVQQPAWPAVRERGTGHLHLGLLSVLFF